VVPESLSSPRPHAWLLGALLAVTACGAGRSPADTVVVAHFGDSTCATDYLPREQHVETLLNAKLAARYPNQKIVNRSVCKSGDYVYRFLHERPWRYLFRTRYAKDVRSRLDRIDVALLRYGHNDRRRYPLPRFREQLLELCDRLEHDYPGVHVVLETNAYIDPVHNATPERDAEYDQLWDVVRAVAKERGYPLVELFTPFKALVDSGHWDMWIRNDRLSFERFGRQIVDDSKDAEMKDELHWFRNGHPAAAAVSLTAELEFLTIANAWPIALPQESAR
jgi:hypothetical protein